MTIPLLTPAISEKEKLILSVNEFKKSGLVSSKYASFKDFEKEKNRYIKLEQKILEKNIESYFKEFQILGSYKKIDYIIDILEATDNGTKNVQDITNKFKNEMDNYVSFKEMIMPVRVANILLPQRKNKGVAYNSNVLRKEIFITLHDIGTYNNFSFEKAMIPYFKEFSTTRNISPLNIITDIPNYIKEINGFEDNLSYNLFICLNFDKTTTLIHEGIHAIYFLNHVNPSQEINDIVYETGALIFGRNLQIDKFLSKINQTMEIYSESKLKEIKQKLYSLNTKVSKYILLHSSNYNPMLQDKNAHSGHEHKQLHKIGKQYQKNVDIYTKAMDNLIEDLTDKSYPLIYGLHEAIRLPFDDFIKLYK